MSAYLLRFDDICPTMNWQVWESIEALLVERKIAPILAVVPNNGDPNLMPDAPREDFWDRARSWQARGWTIGLHGDDHRYVTSEAGIVGLNRRSEFAGLPLDEQRKKIAQGLATFTEQGIKADLFIAPAHSFDENTLLALREHAIDTVSDGFFFSSLVKDGTTFIPQQLWNLKQMPFGLWTSCYHHNGWSDADLRNFEADIDRFRADITSVEEVLRHARPYRWFDSLNPPLWHLALRAAQVRGAARQALSARSSTARAP